MAQQLSGRNNSNRKKVSASRRLLAEQFREIGAQPHFKSSLVTSQKEEKKAIYPNIEKFESDVKGHGPLRIPGPFIEMATSSKDENPAASGAAGGPAGDDVQEWEKRLMSGDLPEDFLKVTEPSGGGAAKAETASPAAAEPAEGTLVDLNPEKNEVNAGDTKEDEESKPGRPMTTEEKDHAMALALQKQLNMEGAAAGGAPVPGAVAYQMAPPPPNAIGKLTVTVVEARLTRNYGIARMDPYCRVRVGHCVYETPTCANGAREPKWNKTFNCYLLAGVKAIDIEIYDECTFQSDAMIAHSNLPIPDKVTGKLEVVDEWWPLSGQEGHDKEGVIHLIMSMQPLSKSRTGPAMIQVQPGQNIQITTAPGKTRPEEVPKPEPPKLSEEQWQEFCKMFPNLDKEVILSVYQENGGNQENTVNGLLVISGS